MTHWRIRWWSALFSNEVIFNWGVYTFICLLSFGRTESALLYSGFLWVWQVGATPPCRAQASRCAGFPCGRAQVPGSQASGAAVWGIRGCGSRVPECRLRSCGSRVPQCRLRRCKAWAQLLRSMWNFPRPGITPVSPELAGGLLASVPPGKSKVCTFFET